VQGHGPVALTNPAKGEHLHRGAKSCCSALQWGTFGRIFAPHCPPVMGELVCEQRAAGMTGGGTCHQHWARPMPAPPPAPSWPGGAVFGAGGEWAPAPLRAPPGGPGFRTPHQDLRPPRQDSELPNTKVQKDSKVSLARFVYPERAPRPWCMIPSPILVKRARTGRGSDALRRPKRASIVTKAKRPSADDIEALGISPSACRNTLHLPRLRPIPVCCIDCTIPQRLTMMLMPCVPPQSPVRSGHA
jgi:hypothetical protein